MEAYNQMGELLSFNWRPPQEPAKLEAGQTALIVIFPGVRIVRLDPAEKAGPCIKPKRTKSSSPRRKSKSSMRPKPAEARDTGAHDLPYELECPSVGSP